MNPLLKLLPLVAVATGGAMNKDLLQAQITRFTETAKVAAVQQEVNDLAKMVYLDTFDDTAPTPEHFKEWVHRNMKPRIGTHRDTSLDFWGHTYRLIIGRARVIVRSAGPDGTYENEDDVYSGFHL